MATDAPLGSLFSFISRFGGFKQKREDVKPSASFHLEGRIERVEGGKCWVDHDYFEIGHDTWVIGSITPGSVVRAKGKFRNGSRLATQVTVNN